MHNGNVIDLLDDRENDSFKKKSRSQKKYDRKLQRLNESSKSNDYHHRENHHLPPTKKRREQNDVIEIDQDSSDHNENLGMFISESSKSFEENGRHYTHDKATITANSTTQFETAVHLSKALDKINTSCKEEIIIPTDSETSMKSVSQIMSSLRPELGVGLSLKHNRLTIDGNDADLVAIAKQSLSDILDDPEQMQVKLNALDQCRLHVFVDESNIFIGAQQIINPTTGRRERNHRIKVIPQAIADLATQGRNCLERVIFGSRCNPVPSTSNTPNPTNSSSSSSSNGHYHPVPVSSAATSLMPQQKAWEAAGFRVHTYIRQPGLGEQFVDDALIASINSSILTYPCPPHPQHTLVLLTGDGNDNDGRVNFKETVSKALLAGWNVELWSWKGSLHKGYKELLTAYEETNLFRILLLDDYRPLITMMTNN